MAADPYPRKDEADADGCGFNLAFNVYPAAEALSYVIFIFISVFFVIEAHFRTMALYHVRMAESLKSKDVLKASEHVAKAAPLYTASADLYPPDDEHSICKLSCCILCLRLTLAFLDLYCCAIDTMYRSGYPVKSLLPILKKIRENDPKMRLIWENSAFQYSGRDKAINAMLKYEEEILEAIQRGSLTDDDTFLPKHTDGEPISLVHDNLAGTKYA